MKTFASVLLVFGICCGHVLAKNGTVVNVNDGVDQILESLHHIPWILEKIEPLAIPDVNEPKFKIKNGQIKGLSNLYRFGDCSYQQVGKIVKVIAQVGVENVEANVDYEAKIPLKWIKGHATMKLEALAVRMDLSRKEISMKDKKYRLDSLKVKHLGDYKITKITGLPVGVNWLLKLIVNKVAKFSRPKIIYAIENDVAKAIGDYLDKLSHSQYEEIFGSFRAN